MKDFYIFETNNTSGDIGVTFAYFNEGEQKISVQLYKEHYDVQNVSMNLEDWESELNPGCEDVSTKEEAILMHLDWWLNPRKLQEVIYADTTQGKLNDFLKTLPLNSTIVVEIDWNN